MGNEIDLDANTPACFPSGTGGEAIPSNRIRHQMETILGSSGFFVTDRTRDLFSFVVLQTLGGKANELKGATIAHEVLGRSNQFNAAKDPIVSIEARKLRDALERYYLSDGRFDPIEIFIPSRSYIPVFAWRSVDLTMSDKLSGRKTRWKPVIVVSPFTNGTGDPNYDTLCVGLTDEVVVELSRFRLLEVNLGRSASLGGSSSSPISGILSASVRKFSSGLKVSVRLENFETGNCVWAEHLLGPEPESLAPGGFEETMSSQIASRVGGEHGAINSHLIMDIWSEKPSPMAKGYEAMMAFYHFDRHRSRASLDEVVPLLHHAVSVDPANGTLLSMLAATKLFTYSFGFSESPQVLNEALDLARSGAQLEPQNQFCLETYALTLFHMGETQASLELLDAALRINPSASYRVALIGWDMMLCGEWKRGRAILESAMELNPGNPSWLWFGVCFDEYRQNRYELALREVNRPDLPKVFWGPLMRAATLAKLGRLTDAKKEVRILLDLKPEMRTRGHSLIIRFIKEQAFLGDLLHGLELAGLSIAIKTPIIPVDE